MIALFIKILNTAFVEIQLYHRNFCDYSVRSSFYQTPLRMGWRFVKGTAEIEGFFPVIEKTNYS